MSYVPTQLDSPFARLGGEVNVLALVERFYDIMSEREPLLARLHPCDAEGRVSQETRDRFALFFIGWLGGPQGQHRPARAPAPAPAPRPRGGR